MKLSVRTDPEEIVVSCEIAVSRGEYTFALAAGFAAEDPRNNGRAVACSDAEPCELPFMPPMMKYHFTALEPGVLSFTYHGAVEDRLSFYQPELRHFSIYNGWYPTGFDAVGEYEVELEAGEDWELVHGTFDAGRGVWRYSTRGQSIVDCNILLFRRDAVCRFRQGAVDVIGFDHGQSELYERIAAAAQSVADFYVELYGNNKLRQMTVVFLPPKYQLGAYMRDGLAVFSEMGESWESCVYLLAHELGHAYAVGAAADTWEDWLNETHAEWSALLYLLENMPQEAEKGIENARKYVGDPELRLRPDGDRRPDNVHEAGTLLYYEIYKSKGGGAIRSLLRTFDELEEKTTAAFLEAVSREDRDIAGFLRAHM